MASSTRLLPHSSLVQVWVSQVPHLTTQQAPSCCLYFLATCPHRQLTTWWQFDPSLGPTEHVSLMLHFPSKSSLYQVHSTPVTFLLLCPESTDWHLNCRHNIPSYSLVLLTLKRNLQVLIQGSRNHEGYLILPAIVTHNKKQD